jgi:repressor LexA
MAEETVRPTKKQREILTFIEEFIQAHGYSPSYREIMKGLDYTSVATVSLHVNSLITRGHLRKRDHSARSIEVVQPSETPKITGNQVTASQEKWLVKQIEARFVDLEGQPRPKADDLDNLYVLVGALKVLGLDGAAHAFVPRLSTLKDKSVNPAEK